MTDLLRSPSHGSGECIESRDRRDRAAAASGGGRLSIADVCYIIVGRGLRCSSEQPK